MSISPEISTSEKIRLRGEAMSLKPSVFVGKEGISDAVIAALDNALKVSPLIKVRASPAPKEQRQQQIAALAAATGSFCVGATGHTSSFYRALPTSSNVEG